jgi:RNA polymerase sigma-70 factor (ECF subfamily)
MVERERTNEDWLRDLQSEGEFHAVAVQDLREYLLRAVYLYYHRRRSDLSHLAREELAQMAEDAAQDALLKILDHLDSFRGDSKFTTWAYRVAINQAAGDLRRRRWDNVSLEAMTETTDETLPPLLATLEDPSAGGNPDQRVIRNQIWELIVDVIQNEFTERQRMVFVNEYFHNVPPDTIAEQLGTNRNNVYKIAHDARMKLRDRLLRLGLSQDEILATFQDK